MCVNKFFVVVSPFDYNNDMSFDNDDDDDADKIKFI